MTSTTAAPAAVEDVVAGPRQVLHDLKISTAKMIEGTQPVRRKRRDRLTHNPAKRDGHVVSVKGGHRGASVVARGRNV